jgi:hypothetical protein
VAKPKEGKVPKVLLVQRKFPPCKVRQQLKKRLYLAPYAFDFNDFHDVHVLPGAMGAARWLCG